MITTFSFKNIPGQIIIELVRFLGIWINQYPSENEVSGVYSPRNIIMVQYLSYDKHCKLIFSSCVESHEDTNITNNMEENNSAVFAWAPLQTFRGAIFFSLKTERMVTHNQKIRENPIPTWAIQHVEAFAVRDGQDIVNGDEPLFIYQFANKNYFTATFHEGGIAGVAQDEDEKDYDDGNYDTNTDENPYDPPGIALETAAACSKIAGVPTPENTVELPGVAPPENEVDDDVVPPLFTSDYDSDNDSDDNYGYKDTSKQHL